MDMSFSKKERQAAWHAANAIERAARVAEGLAGRRLAYGFTVCLPAFISAVSAVPVVVSVELPIVSAHGFDLHK